MTPQSSYQMKNSFNDLQEILQKWCDAAGEKFNINKTEVIPIGEEDHRKNLITNCKLGQKSIIPDHIKITQEGEATRILGAWFGNNMNHEDIWAPIIGKIDRNLERWNKRITNNGRTPPHVTLYKW